MKGILPAFILALLAQPTVAHAQLREMRQHIFGMD